MPKIPGPHIPIDSSQELGEEYIEAAYYISPEQLINAKIISRREDFPKQLKKGIRYLEIGVAWGYSVDYVIDGCSPSSIHLFDLYDQDLKCWSWRKFGECKCQGMRHELLYLPETHEQYIKDKYSHHSDFKTIRGFAPDDLPTSGEYDFIYIDMTNGRIEIREVAKKLSDLVPVGGYLGFNDYLIYDGVIEDKPYGTFQAVNEFLFFNHNWEVDTLALHPLGFNDIYLKRRW